MPSDITHPEIARLIKSQNKKPQIILEIGANDGEDTVKLLSQNRKATVYAFECDPRAIAKWKKRVKAFRVRLFETAIGDQEGYHVFHPSGGNPGGNWERYGDWDKSGSLLPFDRHSENAPWMKFPDPFSVPVTTLDKWAAEHIPGAMIDFVWVDVQGAELLVIQGARETLKRVRYFYCECDPRPNYKGQPTKQQLIDALPGFKLEKEFSYNILFANKMEPVEHEQTKTATPTPVKENIPLKPVSVQMIGQIGNQMFQYCAGKILAEISGLPYSPPNEFVDKQSRPVVWSDDPVLRMIPTEQSKNPTGPPVSFSSYQWIDMEKARNASMVDVSDSYLQRYELYRQWKDKIKTDWLRIQLPWIKTDDNAVYVHVRLTDYVASPTNPLRTGHVGETSGIHEYAECIREFPDAKRIVLVTDAPKDEFLNRFKSLGLPVEISGLAWDKDFMLMASCSNLVISQSTFSWWAGFLGRAKRIACPVFPGSFWHNGINDRGFPHLYVDDEPGRWSWVGANQS
jgi:FkbM family methyltransferase